VSQADWNRARRVILAAAGIALALAVGCGAGEVGDACSEPGNVDQCVDGAVCHDRDSGDDPGVCRFICTDDRDCPDDGSCEDVRDSPYKGCV
jgi:hypothetical protein